MEEKIERLSNKQFSDLMSFSNSLMYGYADTMTTKNTLIDLLNNSKKPTVENLARALDGYSSIDQARVLQSYSEFMEAINMLYKRTIHYYANLLSFDLVITCNNSNDKYKNAEYKSDLNIVYKWLDNFDYKENFKNVVKQCLRRETYYTWFRSSRTGSGKYYLQAMPQSYCYSTGKSNDILVYGFDMSYFLNPYVNIKNYPDIFKEYYRKTFSRDYSKPQIYDDSKNIYNRNGVSNTNVQTSVNDGAWMWKLDTSNTLEVPFLSGAIEDFLSCSETEKLQRDKDIISAYAILAGEIKLLDKQKSGQASNAFAIEPDTINDFMIKFKQGMANNIKATAMPTEDVDLYQFKETNPDMAKNAIEKNIAKNLSGSSVLYGTGKPIKTEIEARLTNDFEFISSMYSQFSKFLEFFVNKKTRKYKFNFTFKGGTPSHIRAKEEKTLTTFMANGFVGNSSLYSGLFGMTPQDFDRCLSEGHNGDLVDKLTPLMNIHTASAKDIQNENGRPNKSGDDMTEGGETSDDYS